MSWLAKYDGTCGKCDRRIKADEHEVYWLHDPPVGRPLGHVRCPDPEPQELVAAREPCPRCFLIPAANGECGCT